MGRLICSVFWRRPLRCDSRWRMRSVEKSGHSCVNQALLFFSIHKLTVPKMHLANTEFIKLLGCFGIKVGNIYIFHPLLCSEIKKTNHNIVTNLNFILYLSSQNKSVTSNYYLKDACSTHLCIPHSMGLIMEWNVGGMWCYFDIFNKLHHQRFKEFTCFQSILIELSFHLIITANYTVIICFDDINHKMITHAMADIVKPAWCCLTLNYNQ